MMKRHREPVPADFRVPVSLHGEASLLFDSLRFEEAIEKLVSGIEGAAAIGNLEESVEVYDCWLLLAQCYFWIGDYAAAREVVAMLEAWRRTRPLCWARWLLQCMISLIDGHYESTHETLSGWIDQCVANGDLDIGEPLLHRGYASLRLGRLEEALEDFEIGYSLARLKQSWRLQVELANFIGITHHIKAHYQHAIEWYTRSKALGSQFQSLTRTGRPALNIGICHYRLGDYTKAIAHLTAALDTLQAAGDRLSQCRTYIALGNTHRLLRGFEEARQCLARAYAMADELDSDRERCLSLEFLGDVHRDEGKLDEARRYYQRGMAIAQALAPDGDLVCELLRRDGECLVKAGQAGPGMEMLARGLQQSRKLGDRFEEGVVLRCLAEGFLQVGDHPQALDYADKAIALLEEIDARHEHAIARLVAGEILLRFSSISKGDDPRDLLDRAWDHSIIAQGIILKLDIDYWTDAAKRLQKQIMKRRQEEMAFQSGAVVLPDTSGGGPLSGDNPASPQIIIAESRAMREVLQAIEAFAPYGDTVLLTGETGTGKELVAQLLHQQGKRKTKPMITVNMSALAPSMFERELFGHAKGSFSSADADGLGLAAAADGGTLFLDEIGELPLEMQVKLLRLLQNGSYMRLGDPMEKRADLRIIAATNKDLKKAVANGQFREDLYHRLACLTIHVPALRDRPEDVLPLLEHYLSVCEQRKVTVDQYFCQLSRRLLERYRWPGNVREVIQVARRACVGKKRYGRVEMVLGDGEESIVLSGPGHLIAAACGAADASSLSRARLLLALEECGGNRAEAARVLGVSRSAVYRRLKKFGLA